MTMSNSKPQLLEIIGDLRTEIGTLTGDLETAQRDYTDSQIQVEELAGRMGGLRTTIEQLERTTIENEAEWSRQGVEYEREYAGLNSQYHEAIGREKELRNDLSTANTTIGNLEGRISDAEDDRLRESAAAEGRYSDLNERYAVSQGRLTEVAEENSGLNLQIEELGRSLTEITADRARESAAAEERYGRLNTDYEASQVQVDSLDRRVSELSTLVENLERTAAEVEAERTREREFTERRYNDLNSLYQESLVRVEDLEGELNTAYGVIEDLDRRATNAEDTVRRINDIASEHPSINPGDIPSVPYVLAGKAPVAAHLETAAHYAVINDYINMANNIQNAKEQAEAEGLDFERSFGTELTGVIDFFVTRQLRSASIAMSAGINDAVFIEHMDKAFQAVDDYNQDALKPRIERTIQQFISGTSKIASGHIESGVPNAGQLAAPYSDMADNVQLKYFPGTI